MSKNRLDFTAKLQRHSHNVTAGLTSSIAPSMILPQYFDYLQPGDSIYYRTHMFARFQDITTAFLGQVDLHIDYFFVPMQMLFTPFGSFFTNTNDPISSFIDTARVNNGALPYGNLQNYFTQEKIDQLSVLQQISGVSDVALKGAWRLLDHLDYNPLCVFWNQVNPPFKAYVPHGFYADLLAYQAIYQKFYRNDEFERFDVAAFNVDTFYDSGAISEAVLDKMLTLRYHGRPDDYFTNVRFSPIASSVNALYHSENSNGLDGGYSQSFEDIQKRVNDFLDGGQGIDQAQPFTATTGSYLNTKPSYMNNAGAYLARYSTGSAGTQYEYFTAQAIRSVFALDKYFRVYGRAGKTYDDQILAHFGVKVPHDVKHDLTHLKHYHMVLQADPILSTADTENGALGQVGGNVQSQLDTNEEKFTAPVHGVFMAVAYVLTRPRYFMTCNRLHMISDVCQFPMPEFDKLGAQPMYGFEFGKPSGSSELFWLNRYQEWKQKYNRVSITYAYDYYPYFEANFFSPWVISRQPYFSVAESSNSSFGWFYEKPSALDCVMATKYSGEWSEDYGATPHLVCQTDPILTEYCCFAKKVSWMSPTGEPDL